MAINYYYLNEDENEMHAQVEPPSRTLIFDTKDLFLGHFPTSTRVRLHVIKYSQYA
jgi:hypothetical protein